MSANLIIHSPFRINSNKFVNQFLQGHRYYKHYNHILIPYLCRDINDNTGVIIGDFIWPVWNTLERTTLSRGCEFNHTYINGKNFCIEYRPEVLSKYYIFGRKTYSRGTMQINDIMLKPDSILLFPIPCDVAKPLIDNKLI